MAAGQTAIGRDRLGQRQIRLPGGASALRASAHRAALARGQSDHATVFKRAQQFAACGILGPSIALGPVPEAAEFARQSVATEAWVSGDKVSDGLDIIQPDTAASQDELHEAGYTCFGDSTAVPRS